ncbi:MAG: hypothetical protein RIQ89_1144 [Bacteroidota bacterium]|jgi:anti-sigma B factor antagonist
MKYTVDKQEKYALIKVAEAKFNSTVAPEIKAEFLYLHNQGYKNFIIDLTGVQYCDSSGLSAILTGNRLSKNEGGACILAGVQDHVRKLISISQLDNILVTIPTVNEAIDFIFMDEIEKQLHKEQ